MPASPAAVRALIESYTEEEIRGLRKQALETLLEGGTTTRNYEGSSMTISVENCDQIIENCNAALDQLTSTAAGNTPGANRAPVNLGVDFSLRRIQ